MENLLFLGVPILKHIRVGYGKPVPFFLPENFTKAMLSLLLPAKQQPCLTSHCHRQENKLTPKIKLPFNILSFYETIHLCLSRGKFTHKIKKSNKTI